MEERIDAAADLRRTYTAMQRLTYQDRQLLELVAVDGLSAVEAARALSISPGGSPRPIDTRAKPAPGRAVG